MIRRRYVGLFVALAALAAGCAGSRTPTSVSHAGSESSRVTGLWWLSFGVGAAVYAIVGGAVVFGALRKSDPHLDDRRRMRERVTIVVGGILVPFLILLFFAGVTVNATAHLRTNAPQKYVELQVTGKRWWWEVQYTSLGITTANEIHLPVGQPVRIRLLSDNVIHSFWVPELAGKEDMIPGQPNFIEFTVKKPGIYRGLCAEYCGLQHAKMQFLVIAQPASDFVTWVAHEQQISTIPTSDATAAGERVFLREACAGCHTIKGTSANGNIGPNLTDLGQRSTIAAGALENTPDNLRRWITNPQSIKPGVLMPPVPLSNDDVNAVVSYLETLR